MHLDGISHAVLFPTQGMAFGCVADRDAASALSRAYNDWLGEYCSADPEHLRHVAHVPFGHIADAVTELERAKEAYDSVGVYLRPNPYPPYESGGKFASDPGNEPFWEAAEGLGVAVCFHEAALLVVPTPGLDRFGPEEYYLIHAGAHPIGQMMAMLETIGTGVPRPPPPPARRVPGSGLRLGARVAAPLRRARGGLGRWGAARSPPLRAVPRPGFRLDRGGRGGPRTVRVHVPGQRGLRIRLPSRRLHIPRCSPTRCSKHRRSMIARSGPSSWTIPPAGSACRSRSAWADSYQTPTLELLMTSTASAAATPVRNQATHDTNLRFLLRPRSVAVVGASGVPTRIGGIIVRLLARHRFPGAVYPINPKYDNIEGFTCYPTLDAVPGDRPIDAAIVYLPLAAVTATVRACGERGVKGVVVISSGFAELGGEGVRLQEELAATANAYDMAMCGPNCAGIANFLADFVAYGTTNFIDLQDIEKGPVALLSASGGLGNTIFTYCQERHVGLSHLIGVGNEAVSTAADYLHLLVDDPDVGVVVGNIEAVRNPRRFFEAADRAAVARKPIVVLKGGRSEAGRHSIMTHTAALGGSPEAFAGAFRQHGVIQVNDLDELADCAMLLTRMEPCTARRLGVFSLPGGGTGLVSDLAADHGFEVPDLTPETIARLADILPDIAIPKNPLDPTAGFGRDSAKMHTALKTFASDPNIDILVFFPLASQVDYSQKLAEDLLAVKDEIGKPIVAIWTAGRDLEPGAWRTLHQGGVPLFVQTGPAFRALALARRYAEHLAGLGDPEARDLGPFAGQRARPLRLGDTAAERAELARFGIRLPRTELATSAAGAAETVAALGGPAAMKIASPDIAHKTEAGGVALGIASADEARDAFDRIVASARAHQPGATIDGVEVQEMIPEGVEMLLGLSTDDQLGPVLTVGLGGVLTEVLGDVAQRPVPVSRAEARRMLKELRGARVLDGFRGRPPPTWTPWWTPCSACRHWATPGGT